MTVVRVRQESKRAVSSEIHSFFLHHMVCCRDFGRKIPAVGCVDDVLKPAEKSWSLSMNMYHIIFSECTVKCGKER